MKILAAETEGFDELETEKKPTNVIEQLIEAGWEDVDEDAQEARLVNTAKNYSKRVEETVRILDSLSTAPTNLAFHGRESTNRVAMYNIEGRTIRFFEKQREEKGYGYATVTFWDNELG